MTCNSSDKLRRKVASVELLKQENRCGHTPFFVAIVKGHLILAEMLLQHRMSDINHQDEQDDSPLHWAIILQNTSAVEFLLERGASINLENLHGNHAIMVAAINDVDEKIMKLLIHDWVKDRPKRKAKILRQLKKEGEEHPELPDHDAFIRELVSSKANKKSMIPLHAVCINGNGNLVKILLQAGKTSDLGNQDIKKMNPIHFAVAHDHSRIIGYLHRDRMCPEGLLHKDYCVIEAGSSGRT